MPRNKKDQSKHKSRRRGKGEGTVYPRKDGRWAAEISLEDGKRKWLYGKTQEEVIAKLKQAQYEMQQGTLATGPKQKFADHLNYWLEEVKKRNLRTSSYKRYRGLLNIHILPQLGQISLQKLTPQKIQSFYNKKLDEGQSPSSVHSMHKIIHSTLNAAVKWKLIGYNPSHGTSLPSKLRRKKNAHALTLEQARHLLITAKGHLLEALIVLALATAMRLGELTALRWGDIDFEKGSVFIHQTASRIGGYGFIENDPKTKTSERTVFVAQNVCDLLKAHRVQQDKARLAAGPRWHENNLVFCNKYGKFLNPDWVRASFYKLLEKAELPRIRIHDLRHTASTLFRSLGIDLKVVQEMLGHSDIDITANVYSHVFLSMQKEAAEKIKKVFEGLF